MNVDPRSDFYRNAFGKIPGTTCLRVALAKPPKGREGAMGTFVASALRGEMDPERIARGANLNVLGVGFGATDIDAVRDAVGFLVIGESEPDSTWVVLWSLVREYDPEAGIQLVMTRSGVRASVYVDRHTAKPRAAFEVAEEDRAVDATLDALAALVRAEVNARHAATSMQSVDGDTQPSRGRMR